MKSLLLILIVTLAARLHAMAEDPFLQAQSAYDSGHYAEAAALYESLLADGIVNSEVHYNLGNAFFKERDLPDAVWNYRKAWYEAPRDPDINANLHFALNAAGAIEPDPSMIERFFTSFSLTEWGYTAVAGYLGLSMLLLCAMLWRTARAPLLKLGLVPAAVLLLAAGGWWQWRQFRTNPECVVVHSGVTALYAPVAGGTAYYKVPLGALVRQRNTDPKGWSEVEYDGKTGWIKMGNLIYLTP